MKRFKAKYLAYLALPAAALALAGANAASAHGFWGQTPEDFAARQQEMFQHQADMLGTSPDTVKNAWAQGKTMLELAQELGISETDLQTKTREARKTEMKERFQTLVSQGIITQAQADQRYSFMEQRLDNAAPGKGMGRKMFGGWGRHGPGF